MADSDTQVKSPWLPIPNLAEAMAVCDAFIESKNMEFGPRWGRRIAMETLGKGQEFVTRFSTTMTAWIWRHRGDNKLPGVIMPQVYLVILDDEIFNARAFEQDGFEFIAINSGVINAVLRIICQVMADPSVLSDIGDVASEVASPQRYEPVDKNISAVLKQYPMVIPKGPTRIAIAEYMAMLCLTFITSHEFIHLKNGHVRLMKSATGLALISEIDSLEADIFSLNSPANSITPMDIQAMEVDADSIGLCMTLGFAGLTNREGGARGYFCLDPQELDYYAASRPPVQKYKCCLFAVLLVHLLLAKAVQKPQDAENKTHPNEALRSVFAQATADKWMKLANEDHESILGKSLVPDGNMYETTHAAATEVIGAIGSICTPSEYKIKFSAFSENLTNINAYRHHAKIQDQWAKIYPKLLVYARGWLVPPDPRDMATTTATEAIHARPNRRDRPYLQKTRNRKGRRS